MLAFDVVKIVGRGEEISHKDTGRPCEAVGCRYDSLAGAGDGTPNHDAAGRGSGEKLQVLGDRHGGECSQFDMPATKPGGRDVQKGRGEDVRFLEAEQLRAQGERSVKNRV